MKRPVTTLLAFCFILWIMPLGFFIKPSQQKLACDGQRAMCMCHAMIPKSSDKAMEAGISLKAGSSANKENSTGGAGNYFVSSKAIIALNIPLPSFFKNQFLSYNNPFLVSLEHVPKF